MDPQSYSQLKQEIGERLRELPETLEDRHDIAFNLVREVCERIFGAENEGWHTFKRPSRKNKEGKYITWVKAGKA